MQESGDVLAAMAVPQWEVVQEVRDVMTAITLQWECRMSLHAAPPLHTDFVSVLWSPDFCSLVRNAALGAEQKGVSSAVLPGFATQY
eukprot:1158018-Pelagomonas_calceolata.AAC.4